MHFDEGCPRFDEQDLDEVLALADAMLRKVPDHGRMLNDLVAAMLEVDSIGRVAIKRGGASTALVRLLQLIKDMLAELRIQAEDSLTNEDRC